MRREGRARGNRDKAAAPPKWKNRIVRYGEVDPATLVANPNNWRIHPKEQVDAIEGALSEIGWIQSVVINETTGNMVDGHARVKKAVERGEKKVPAVWVRLSLAEEKKALLTLDPIAALAESNAELLEALTEEVLADQDTGGAIRQFLKDQRADRQREAEADDDDQANDEAVLLDQAIQLRPSRDYIVVMCDDDHGADFEKLKQILGLKQVRRGGYKPGNAFDDIGLQRVIKAKDLFAVLEAGYGKRG